jgi:hypothetical protein
MVSDRVGRSGVAHSGDQDRMASAAPLDEVSVMERHDGPAMFSH